jgi:hypothetical protein
MLWSLIVERAQRCRCALEGLNRAQRLRCALAGARSQKPEVRIPTALPPTGLGSVVSGQWSVTPGILMALLVSAASAYGAIFPDQIGDFKKGPVKTIAVPDQALYAEYGLDASEQAEYAAGPKHFSATLWRMRDSTGAMALFESRRPPGAIPVKLSKLAVQTSDGVIFAYGNYVFRMTGDVPPTAALQSIYDSLPKLEQSPLPPLMTDLPVDGLVPNSERYILGPVSLDRFEARIPPSVAAFHLGAEGQLGSYQTAQGPMTLAIFSYPTPSIARQQYQDFQKIPGGIARRVGNLVAVTVAPPDRDAAERLLSQVHYDTNMVWNEPIPDHEVRDKVRYILDVFVFAGLLIAGCVVAGVAFGGYRTLMRKLRRGDDPEAMITLHLS